MTASTGTLERSSAAMASRQLRAGRSAARRAALRPAERRHGAGEAVARRATRPAGTPAPRAQELPAHELSAQARPVLGLANVTLAIAVTASVLLLPALIVRVLLRPTGLSEEILCALLAAALSIAIARAEALVWQRSRRAGDLLYGELMLWGLARRWWVERRLRLVTACYECAAASSRGRVELLAGLNRLLEARNTFTYRHCRRVARYAEQIARALHLPADEIARVRCAALVHDVGKVYTPLAILHKPGPLTEEEFAIVKRHAADGAEMLAPVHDAQLAMIVRHHHERIDGSGYPDGLAGEQIPIGARIVAVADTFDAITSQRPYRRARSHGEGLEVLAAEAGAQLDARAVAAFQAKYSARRSVASAAFATAFLDRVAAALLPWGLGGAAAVQLLPALGAAGVLAMAPGLHAAKPPQREAAPLAAALSSPFGATLADASSTAFGSTQAQRPTTGSHAGATPRAGLYAPSLARRRSAATTQPAPAAAGGSAASSAPAATGAPGAESHAPKAVNVKVPSLPASPPAGTSPVERTLPSAPVTTPTTTPSVTTPPLTTPSVEVPAVHAGPVSTPAVEVPAVHAPAVAAPTVQLPQLP